MCEDNIGIIVHGDKNVTMDVGRTNENQHEEFALEECEIGDHMDGYDILFILCIGIRWIEICATSMILATHIPQ